MYQTETGGESGVFYESENSGVREDPEGGQAQWVEYVGTSDAMSVAWLFWYQKRRLL